MGGMKSANFLTKFLLISLVIISSCLLLFSVVAEGFAQQPTSMGEISGMMGRRGDNGGMGGMMDDDPSNGDEEDHMMDNGDMDDMMDDNNSNGDEEDHMMDNGDMDDMMDQMRGNDQNTYTNAVVAGLAASSVALVAGALVLLWLKNEKAKMPIVKTEAPLVRMDELDIIKRALSDSENAVIDEIRRAGEITQDSLRFRLEWSKSKLSRILTNLDKINLIQRDRVGKTYNVFLTGKRAER